MMKKINLLVFTILLMCNSIKTFAYCELTPYQRAEADIPVKSAYANLPKSYPGSIIVSVVNHAEAQKTKIPVDNNNPRLHSHIWIVDKSKCKKLLVLPLPENASINIHAIETDIHALPINLLKNNDLEFKYIFSVPEDLHTLIIRRVIVNNQWQITKTQDITLSVQGDAQEVAKLADWHPNGNLLDASEQIKNTENYMHYTILFDQEKIMLFKYSISHPETEMTSEGIMFDSIKLLTNEKKQSLFTSFSLNMKHYRQFSLAIPEKNNGFPIYTVSLTNHGALFQLGPVIFNQLGVIIYETQHMLSLSMPLTKKIIENYQRGKRQRRVLPDYEGVDKLQTNNIETFIWRNNQWISDPSSRPHYFNMNDIIKNNYSWPKN